MPIAPEAPPEVTWTSCYDKQTHASLHLQYCHAKSIIVFHPGSLNLRVGRASDLNPLTILHAVARKRSPGGIQYADPFLPSRIELVNS